MLHCAGSTYLVSALFIFKNCNSLCFHQVHRLTSVTLHTSARMDHVSPPLARTRRVLDTGYSGIFRAGWSRRSSAATHTASAIEVLTGSMGLQFLALVLHTCFVLVPLTCTPWAQKQILTGNARSMYRLLIEEQGCIWQLVMIAYEILFRNGLRQVLREETNLANVGRAYAVSQTSAPLREPKNVDPRSVALADMVDQHGNTVNLKHNIIFYVGLVQFATFTTIPAYVLFQSYAMNFLAVAIVSMWCVHQGASFYCDVWVKSYAPLKMSKMRKLHEPAVRITCPAKPRNSKEQTQPQQTRRTTVRSSS